MQITIDVSEKVEAKAHGVSVGTFVKKVAEQAAEPEVTWERIEPGPYTPQEAGRNIRELSKGLTLGGDIRLKELIREGHKY